MEQLFILFLLLLLFWLLFLLSKWLPIEFKIDDKDFLEQVYDQEIKFGNGTSITCNLQIETKTTIKDDIEEAKTYYIVKLITQWSDDEHFQYDTKKYKKIKKEQNQPK